jgi:hypothetical protein
VDDRSEPKRAGLLDDYIGEPELAAELNINLRTAQRWRKLQIGPPFVMKGITPIYNKALARQWLAAGGTAAASNNRRRRRGA